MMAVDMRAFVAPSYVMALVVHGLFIVVLVGAAVPSAFFVAGAANTVRWDTLAFAVAFIPPLLGALPSLVALASWFLLWRRDMQPSMGHRALTIGWAAVLFVLMVIGMAGA